MEVSVDHKESGAGPDPNFPGNTTLLALASSIPPFFSVWFEVVADRKGLLAKPQLVGATSAP